MGLRGHLYKPAGYTIQLYDIRLHLPTNRYVPNSLSLSFESLNLTHYHWLCAEMRALLCALSLSGAWVTRSPEITLRVSVQIDVTYIDTADSQMLAIFTHNQLNHLYGMGELWATLGTYFVDLLFQITMDTSRTTYALILFATFVVMVTSSLMVSTYINENNFMSNKLG